MNCPNCGAAVEPLPNRDHFRCTHCDSLHFPEPTGEGIVLLDRPHPLNCPRCTTSMTEGRLDGAKIGHCAACRGLLMNSGHFARVIARRREARGLKEQFVEPIDPKELRQPCRCPKCGKRTETHAYGGGGNAVIDSCHRCGLIWLDAGELTILEQFAAR